MTAPHPPPTPDPDGWGIVLDDRDGDRLRAVLDAIEAATRKDTRP